MLNFQHIKFNFKGIPSEKSKQAIFEYAKEIIEPFIGIEGLGNISLDLPENYHITFGQSTYFARQGQDENGDRLLQKVDKDDDNISRDYQNILKYLQKNLSEHLSADDLRAMHEYDISGLKISENGFVFLRLVPNSTLSKITKCYQNASKGTRTRFENTDLGLVKYYQPDANFDFHITIGKMNHWPQKKTYETTMSPELRPQVELTKAMTLDASYKAFGNHVNIMSDTIPLPERKIADTMSLLLNLFPRMQITERKTAPQEQRLPTPSQLSRELLNLFPRIQITERKTAPQEQRLPTPSQVDLALGAFGFAPLNIREDQGQFVITFANKDERTHFCKIFKQFPERNRGLCKYDDHSIIRVRLDAVAVNTLLSHASTEPARRLAAGF